jgi:hypothetical protein
MNPTKIFFYRESVLKEIFEKFNGIIHGGFLAESEL